MSDKELARRAKIKQQVDARIAEAQDDRGSILLLTGNGKGKTTAGFGTLFRAIGHNQNVAVVQFIKGNDPCGERELLQRLAVPVYTMNTGFSWDSNDPDGDRKAAQSTWEHAKTLLADPSLEMVLLDELTYMLNWGYLPVEEVIASLQQRPATMTVIITGRAAHRQLKALADTVSEIQPVKHGFEQGLKARAGLDW
ncbi:cob(I)yrinic acid a,c-diamide adenosyltransferase [Ferrimonas balearica]|uniref:cob(I)yrinic acid a,c-diamide adenosyltransferase n=1 Tax=Ferrimonas balearica TaxID=44012 RepID=UPI001F3FC4BA|nr:cob(I)yrinic acid a,c-diamide adenosyltransferase [Ferrimonas balearica]MBY6096787.1 cob(I)yrinic acid a,c-diamide adenosyltransferase [Ferrimonas balearica]